MTFALWHPVPCTCVYASHFARGEEASPFVLHSLPLLVVCHAHHKLWLALSRLFNFGKLFKRSSCILHHYWSPHNTGGFKGNHQWWSQIFQQKMRACIGWGGGGGGVRCDNVAEIRECNRREGGNRESAGSAPPSHHFSSNQSVFPTPHPPWYHNLTHSHSWLSLQGQGMGASIQPFCQSSKYPNMNFWQSQKTKTEPIFHTPVSI